MDKAVEMTSKLILIFLSRANTQPGAGDLRGRNEQQNGNASSPGLPFGRLIEEDRDDPRPSGVTAARLPKSSAVPLCGEMPAIWSRCLASVPSATKGVPFWPSASEAERSLPLPGSGEGLASLRRPAPAALAPPLLSRSPAKESWHDITFDSRPG